MAEVELLKAPFPWFGGKLRARDLCWARFGDVPNYVEPFAGSLAVLLGRPSEPRIETVNDLDCYIANFWRAIAADPEQVARYADGPVNEADLHARHRWLVDRVGFRMRMRSDPMYFDAKIAGWWVWGLCAWIGSGWCVISEAEHLAQQRPNLGGEGTGVGIHGARNRSRIVDVFTAISERIRHTRVVCGDFERALGDTVTVGHGTTAVLLDPPYDLGARYASLYAEDASGIWERTVAWAAEHGADKRLRIALCGYAGTWTPPEGWSEVVWKAPCGYGGQRKEGKNDNAERERIWFSPGCLKLDATPAQGSLFGG